MLLYSTIALVVDHDCLPSVFIYITRILILASVTTMLSTASNSVSSRPKRTAKKRKQVFGDENAVRANGRAFGPPPKRRKKQVRLSTDVEVFDIPPHANQKLFLKLLQLLSMQSEQLKKHP